MANEKRLIDANYIVNKMIRNCQIEEGGIPLGDFDKHQKILALYPTVDAAPVVRCGDCAYATPDGYVCFGNGEMMPPHPTYPDRHCSCGERRTDNG